MAEYSGKDLQVFWNTIDISGQGRRVVINETAGEPEEVDITHRGDTERTALETYPGTVKTNVEYSCLDESGGSAALLGIDINDQDTLYIYPEGKTHGNAQITVTNARLIDRSQPVEYDQAVELEATFHAKNGVTRDTYSSA
jgi:hypothetical protein